MKHRSFFMFLFFFGGLCSHSYSDRGNSKNIHAIQQQTRVFTFNWKRSMCVYPFVLGYFPSIQLSMKRTTSPVPETRSHGQSTACAHPSTLNALLPMWLGGLLLVVWHNNQRWLLPPSFNMGVDGSKVVRSSWCEYALSAGGTVGRQRVHCAVIGSRKTRNPDDQLTNGKEQRSS